MVAVKKGWTGKQTNPEWKTVSNEYRKEFKARGNKCVRCGYAVPGKLLVRRDALICPDCAEEGFSV